jgi:galactokinase
MVSPIYLSHPRSDLKSLFRTAFGREPVLLVSAPGRVNLIGEHTDYNQGFVLPAAIDRFAVMAVATRRDRRVSLYAANFATRAEFSLDAIDRDQEQSWSNYQRGVAAQLQAAGHYLLGMDALIWGNVPIGSGLGSSAAVEVATAHSFQLLNDLEIDGQELALLCQRAEREFVGVDCGVMDQLIAVLGRRDHALLIDCRDLALEYARIPAGASIMVADTMVRRDLLSSEYNTRRQECQRAAELLRVPSLREVSSEKLATCGRTLPSPLRKRARHVVSENQRVLDAVAALKKGDLEGFGFLMNESHRSLRDDFEVSSPELDTLVEAAREVEGVFGSRLTGAGFGGCTVSLVAQEAVERFKAHVSKEYEEAAGIPPEIHICRAEDGLSHEVLSVER